MSNVLNDSIRGTFSLDISIPIVKRSDEPIVREPSEERGGGSTRYNQDFTIEYSVHH